MMETINRRNYERFLIDFADGILSPDQHALVILFLEQNPDIAEELEGMLEIELEATHDGCENINSLKKTIRQPLILNIENYEHYFIAYHEGDLNEDEKIQVEEFVAMNPKLEKDFLLFHNISFNSSNETLYVDKTGLKRISLANGESILEKDFYDLCIAYHEGDLDTEYITLINNTVYRSEVAATIFNSFANLQLSPNENIIYPNKTALKKKGALVFGTFGRIGASIAAAIAFVVLYYFTGQVEVNIPPKVNYPTDIATTIQPTNTNTQDNIETTESKTEDSHSIISNVEIINSTKPSTNKYKRRQNNSIQTINDTRAIGKLANSSVDMQLLDINIQEQFVKSVDTGYYMVVASNDNRIIERNLPSPIKSTIRKVTRLFIKEKEAIKAESARNSIMNMAQYAVTGFNKMTENNYSLSRVDAPSSNPKEQEKRK